MNKTYKVKTITIGGCKLHVGDTVAWHTFERVFTGSPYEEALDEPGRCVNCKKVVIIYDIEKHVDDIIRYRIYFDNGKDILLRENELENAEIYKVNIPTDFDKLNLVPKNWKELYYVVHYYIAHCGKNADLNCIDVSNVGYMNNLFSYSSFNGDISKWDVSNVIDMHNMFEYSNFNGDISNWNVNKVDSMASMFKNSKFNGDISKWDVSHVITMENMFKESIFAGNISNWNVNKVKYHNNIFKNSKIKTSNKPKFLNF